MLFAHFEEPAFPELKAAGGDKVLGGQPSEGKPLPFKIELLPLIQMEDGMQQAQPVFAIHDFAFTAQAVHVFLQLQSSPLHL